MHEHDRTVALLRARDARELAVKLRESGVEPYVALAERIDSYAVTIVDLLGALRRSDVPVTESRFIGPVDPQ